MKRFLLLLVTTRWGWALIAALIILGGIILGTSSPLIPYQNSLFNATDSQSYYIGVAHDNNIYIWTTDKNNPTFYVARESDFNPAIDRTKLHLDNRLSFVDRSDTISVSTTLADNVQVTQAHIIEQLTLYDTNNNVTGTYNASGYSPGDSGYVVSRWWPGGIAAIFVGLLVGYIALFVRRKKRVPATDQNTPGWPFANIPPYSATDATRKP